MFILDTDHLTIVQRRSPPSFFLLSARLANLSPSEVYTTIINVEEQMRGWLTMIGRAKRVQQEILGYRQLHQLFAFFAEIPVLDYDETAAERFLQLRRNTTGIGSMDLKIGAIAISRGATVLTRNLRDFRRIPGVDAQDWTQVDSN